MRINTITQLETGDILIQLTKGHQCAVDAASYILIKDYSWYAAEFTSGVYAVTTLKGKQVFMHVMLLPHAEGNVTDHVSGDTLDNRIQNLREATKGQNNFNRRRHKNNTSGYAGVSWYPRYTMWRARISAGGKLIHIGYAKKLEDAIAMRKKAEKEHYASFAIGHLLHR